MQGSAGFQGIFAGSFSFTTPIIVTPEANLPNRANPVDPLVALQGMGQGMGMAQAGGAPDVNQLAEGVRNTLKTIMAAAVSVAETVPSTADRMKQVRQLAMESMLQVQNMAESGQGGDSGGGY